MMAEAAAIAGDPAPSAKKGKKKLLFVALAALIVGGAGAGGGLFAAGMIGGHHDAEEKVDLPKLITRDGGEEEAIGDGTKTPNPAKYKATYYPIEDNFTANLRDSDGFAQVGIGVSTYYDARVVDAVKLHEMAVRSAVLMTLSDQDKFVITTPKGKDDLKRALTKAVNNVLKEKEGFGGIADVYFTSFVIQ